VTFRAPNESGTRKPPGGTHCPRPRVARVVGWGGGALLVILAVIVSWPTSVEVSTVAGKTLHPTVPRAPVLRAPLRPYAISDQMFTVTDASRPTPPRGDVPGSTERVLAVVVRRPIGPKGPLPLVVFAHGWNSNPGEYEPLLDAWAAAGYLVAAPVFPDSTNLEPGAPVSDYQQQAKDLSFVITTLIGGVAGQVDAKRIAVAGHSDGGTDVALMALNPGYSDHRVAAYLSLSGEIATGTEGPWGVATPGALLVAVGTADQYGLFPLAVQVFQVADMAKVLLTVADGDHLSAFVGATAQAQAVRVETVRFLAAALYQRSADSAELASALLPAGDPAINVQAG
jgi:pimeloyl-ACP methyl ester carboxylesterase